MSVDEGFNVHAISKLKNTDIGELEHHTYKLFNIVSGKWSGRMDALMEIIMKL